jgi:SRSO17 transposase
MGARRSRRKSLASRSIVGVVVSMYILDLTYRVVVQIYSILFNYMQHCGTRAVAKDDDVEDEAVRHYLRNRCLSFLEVEVLNLPRH